jgi:hypothetical protein
MMSAGSRSAMTLLLSAGQVCASPLHAATPRAATPVPTKQSGPVHQLRIYEIFDHTRRHFTPASVAMTSASCGDTGLTFFRCGSRPMPGALSLSICSTGLTKQP